jgi:hypothetical protein
MPDPLTERRGVNAVEAVFLNDFKWIFREQAVSDFGIDAQAEVVEFDKPTGKLMALQIKTGASYFRKHGDDFIFYGERRHLDYWLGHSLPVFLILHDPDRSLTLWQKIDLHLVKVTEKGWSIVVPAANVLSAASKEAFATGLPNDLSSIRRYRMAMDMDMMKLLAEKEEVYFEIEHWTSKSLGMRGIAVMYDEYEKDPPDFEINWMYPAWNHQTLMAFWFPWLDYVHIEMRETMSAEIDIIVLHVWVNDLGKRYIALEEFFANGRPVQEDDEIPVLYTGDHLDE